MNAQQKAPHGIGNRQGSNQFRQQNYTVIEVISQFQSAMAERGMVVSGELIPDGKLHRVHIEGHRSGSLNGAYVLHADKHPAGWFQDFKAGLVGTWTLGGGDWHMSEDTMREIEEARRQREIERAERNQEAKRKAEQQWRVARPVEENWYLIKKGVQSHGLRAQGTHKRSDRDRFGCRIGCLRKDL